ncbi:MAG TPA: nuclear transport factor 2 family protein [Actinomycetota bacterium]|nr:nuclear transport factor 2 family protein [Actinomycetota bacterium]
MADTAARAGVLRDAMLAAVTGDLAAIERAYTEDVTGWSPVTEVVSRDDPAADLAGRAGAFSDVDLVLDPVDAVGDKLIAEWRVAATHIGLLTLDEELALEPTGRRIDLRAWSSPSSRATASGGSAGTGTRSSCSTASACCRPRRVARRDPRTGTPRHRAVQGTAGARGMAGLRPPTWPARPRTRPPPAGP